jgi:hypothetical protein
MAANAQGISMRHITATTVAARGRNALLRAASVAVLLFVVPAAQAISEADRLLLTTRTVEPTVSSQLAAALDLGLPHWHRPGATPPKVKIGDATRRASAQAAFDAMQALPPNAAQNDFDRAWLALQKGAALQYLGRTPEAAAQFGKIFDIAGRTMLQDRTARAALHALGERSLPGWCADDIVQRRRLRPYFPKLAKGYAVEGWAQAVADVAADGSVEYVFVINSSMRVFEPPTIEWLRSTRFVGKDGKAPGQPCYEKIGARFKFDSDGALFKDDTFIANEGVWSYPSIGASRRVREAAVEALQRGEPEPATLTAPR